MHVRLRPLLLTLFLSTSIFFVATPSQAADNAPTAANAGLYLKVRLDAPVKFSKLRPGDKISGALTRDVYSQDLELFPTGDRVEMTVDHLEKRKRVPNDHWPWVIKAFTPRHESYPVFKTATVFAAASASNTSAAPSTLQVSLLSVNNVREVHAQGKKSVGTNSAAIEVVGEKQPGETSAKSGHGAKKPIAPTMVLEAFGAENRASDFAALSLPDSATLPAGTPCKVLLMNNVSASKSKPGDVVQGRLLEPVRLNSQVVLPAGTMFDGTVTKKTPPRWASRAGSLSLEFSGLTLPGGNRVPVAASVTGAELDQRSHTRIDAEGKLHGERPGKAWMAINIGVTAGLAKEVDDGTQLVIEAIVSTATDASTAGTARIAATCISGIFMITRHGRDVVLPRFTEMNISLDRPLLMTKTADQRP